MAKPLKASPAPAAAVENRDTSPTAAPASEPSAESLMALFTAADSGEEEEVTEETPTEEASETPEEASDDTETAEVAPDEETPTEDTPEEPTLHEVTVDGDVEKVTLEQLKAGYSRTSDYTRKTQAVAEDRRRLEADASVMRADRERYIAGLKEVETFLSQGDAPDWTKLAEEMEPAEFNKARARWDARMERVTAIRRQREAEEAQSASERQAMTQQQVRAEQQRLYAAIPEWKDRGKAESEQQAIVDYALKTGESYGVTPESVGQITTAFPILVLRKAMLYDKLMAAKPKVVAQKVPTPTAKPGAKVVQNKLSPKQQAFERLAKSGDIHAAEDYFLARLTEASR